MSLRLILLHFLLASAFAHAEASDCLSIQNLSPNSFPMGPVDGAGKVAAELKWTPLTTALKYEITFSRTEDFSKFNRLEKAGASLHVRVFPNKSYFWRVKAFDAERNLLSCPIDPPFEFVITDAVGEAVPPSETEAAITETLPAETAQVESPAEPPPPVAPPVAFVPATEDKIKIAVTAPESTSSVATPETEPINLTSPARAWLSTDVGYLNFAQNNAEIGSIQAAGLLFPSVTVGAQTANFGRFFLSGYLQQTTGQFSSNAAGISLVDSQFQWQRYRASIGMNLNSKWSLYVALEQISTPYFYALSPQIMTLKVIDQTNAVIGATYQIYQSTKWTYQLDAAYSTALAAKGAGLTSAKISGIMLDLNLNAVHYTSRGLYYGGGVKMIYRNLTQKLNSESFVSSGTAETNYYSLNVMGGFLF